MTMEAHPVGVEDLKCFLVSAGDAEGNCTDIVLREDLGRAVVATKAFPDVGKVIIRERPLLVWSYESGGFGEYLDCFLEAPPEVKTLVLDMHIPPHESVFMESLRSTATMYCTRYAKYEALGLDKIMTLLGVSNINAHEYYGKPCEDFIEVVSGSQRVSSGNSALFAFGSKIAHSCCPNATYSSKTADGCLEYKSVAPIKVGDLITFPYIDNTPSIPTHIRRQQLMESKAFFCECDLCTGIDYARTHWCRKTGGCSGRVACVQPNQESKPSWSCTECGPTDEACARDLERKETYILKKLESMVMKMGLPGGIFNVHPSEASNLVTVAINTLSSVHFLALKCMEECSRTCASHAHIIDGLVQMGVVAPHSPTPFGSLNSVRLMSAATGLRFVRGCECVAAKCATGQHEECNIQQGDYHYQHPPVYSCNPNAFHVFVDLKGIQSHNWPEGSVAMLRRYVPLCYMQFGSNDRDIQEMEATLLSVMVEKNEKKDAPTKNALGGQGHGHHHKKGNSGGRTNKKKKGKNKGRKK